MASVIVVGDGPGGLSAALFLAKKQQDVRVFAQNGTWMNSALLLNYLGLPKITGKEFMAIAKQQVTNQGGQLIDAEVTGLSKVSFSMRPISVQSRHDSAGSSGASSGGSEVLTIGPSRLGTRRR